MCVYVCMYICVYVYTYRVHLEHLYVYTVVLVVRSRAMCMLGKHCSTKLYPAIYTYMYACTSYTHTYAV